MTQAIISMDPEATAIYKAQEVRKGMLLACSVNQR